MTTPKAPWLHIVGIGEDGLAGLAPATRAVVEAAEVILFAIEATANALRNTREAKRDERHAAGFGTDRD